LSFLATVTRKPEVRAVVALWGMPAAALGFDAAGMGEKVRARLAL
jgi:hypothetical protein